MDTMTPGCLTLFVGIAVCYVLFFVVWTAIDAIRGRKGGRKGATDGE